MDVDCLGAPRKSFQMNNNSLDTPGKNIRMDNIDSLGTPGKNMKVENLQRLRAYEK
jgi:hypothetical protein